MKIKTINRSEEAFTRERAQDVQKVHHNLDPALHPFEKAVEYTRAVKAGTHMHSSLLSARCLFPFSPPSPVSCLRAIVFLCVQSNWNASLPSRSLHISITTTASPACPATLVVSTPCSQDRQMGSCVCGTSLLADAFAVWLDTRDQCVASPSRPAEKLPCQLPLIVPSSCGKFPLPPLMADQWSKTPTQCWNFRVLMHF